MVNRYDPNQNIPGYIPPAPTLMQGQPLQVIPSSLQGCSQEELRQEMMRRTGQYGPIPRHRARGVLGGPVTISEAQWYPGIRADQWHDDAVGADNASWKTIVVRQEPAFLYDANKNSLGLIVRLRMGSGGAQNQLVYVSCVPNGVVHIPICAETVIAEVALTQNIFTSAQLAAINGGVLQGPKSLQSYFDNPPPTKPVLNGSVAFSAAAGLVQLGAVLGQGLASSQINNPTRQISVKLLSTGDSAVIPIPAGAQTVQIASGAADLVVGFFTEYGDGTTATQSISVANDVPRVIPDTASGISLSSASNGGLVTVIFYLGI